MNILPFDMAVKTADAGYLLWLADFFSHRPYDDIQLYRAQIVLFPIVVNSARRNGYELNNATLAQLFTIDGLKRLLRKKPGKKAKWLVKPLLDDQETPRLLADLSARLSDHDAPQLDDYLVRDCSEWDREEIEIQVRECIRTLGTENPSETVDNVA